MRLVSRLAPPAAIATLAATALAVSAAPASAEINCANANAKAAFLRHMNEARFFIGLADTARFLRAAGPVRGRDPGRRPRDGGRRPPTSSAC